MDFAIAYADKNLWVQTQISNLIIWAIDISDLHSVRAFRIFIRIRYRKFNLDFVDNFAIAYPDENPKMLLPNVNNDN